MRIKMILAVAAAAFAGGALASNFPNKPVRLIVPYAAGGSTDLIARTAARLMERSLQVPVVVENKPGANTIVAARLVAGSPADGYTVLVAGTASTNVNHLLYKNSGYDIERDLVPVGMLSRMPYAVFVNPKLGVSTPGELKSLAKSAGKDLSYATAGNGNPMHLAALMFEAQAGSKMVQIPYQGSAPALNALVSGDVQLSFDVLGTALPFVEAGRIKLLAVATSKRIGQVPSTPTMLESGFADFVVETGFALMVPSSTPGAAVAKLNAALNEALRSSDYADAVEKQILVPYPPMSVSEAKEEMRREREKWGRVIKTNSIILD